MKLTPVLRGPPVFHFWKDFGAGKKRRIPYYKYWRDQWRYRIAREEVKDHTIPVDKLPPNSRLMEAEDFMTGPLDALPAQLMQMKNERVVYDHPWPFNVKVDPVKSQTPMYHYNIGTRFFKPRPDALVLTNTLLETDSLEAEPPFEPSDEQLATIQRQYEWATEGDSSLLRMPRRRIWPKINITPRVTYGILKERKERHVLESMMDYSQTLLAQHLHRNSDQSSLKQVLHRQPLTFPCCRVLFKRNGKDMNLDLTIDSLLLNKSPLPLINPDPESTRARPPVVITPRTWRSLLEPTRNYVADWSFGVPPQSHLHTIQLASRIKRDYKDPDEMLARLMVHAFGLSAQFITHKSQLTGSQSNLPVVLQAIGLDIETERFFFLRYQLNNLELDDDNDQRLKNQAWYSGPIVGLREALRYYLDFQAYDLASSVRAAGAAVAGA